jgi:hypothetical protein
MQPPPIQSPLIVIGNRGNIEHGGRAVMNSVRLLPICITAVEFVTTRSNPIACHTVWKPKGWIAMRWMPVDSYDLIIGAAIVCFLAIIAVVALI